MVRLKFTDEEWEYVAKELAQKLFNLIYMRGEEYAKRYIEQLKGLELDEDEDLTLEFKFHFVPNDLIVIVGGLRREKVRSP